MTRTHSRTIPAPTAEDRGAGGPGRAARRPEADGRSRARGLSIFELLISLTICAMLLTAVATTFHASSAVIRHNDEFFRASQAARVTMTQILSEVRQCDDVDVLADRLEIGRASNDGVNGADIRYRYDAANKRIMFCPNAIDPVQQEYLLCANVRSVTFAADRKPNEGGIWYTTRVTVELTIEVGQNQVTLTGSAAPRRAAAD